MRPIAWIVFILICVGMFFAAILPMTANCAFVLMGLGMDDSAVPVALVICTVLLVGAIIKGAMS